MNEEILHSLKDDDLLKKLFHKYREHMIFYACQVTRDREAAKDIVQESFLNYWKSKHKVACDEKYVRNFLYVTIKNASLKWLKRQSIAKAYLDSRREETVEEPGVLRSMIRAEMRGKIYNILNALPSGCRTVTKLSYIEGKSNQEVADQLAISVNTVKTHKQRALRYFRSCLSHEMRPQFFFALFFFFDLLSP